MRKNRIITLLLLALVLPMVSMGQIPDGFNYQAVLRDAQSKEMIDTEITVKFGIVSGSVSGTLVWEEEHATATNSIGLFSLILGEGIKSGGTLPNFSEINWGITSMFLKISVNVGGTWSDFDPTPVMSVPFARTAQKTLDNPFVMSGDTVTLMNGSLSIGSNSPMKSQFSVVSKDDDSEDALFEVRRADGQTVFAVYNEGVRIYLPIEPVTKGPRGGFAIGGFDRNKGIIVEDYLWVTPDSIRMYIDKTPELVKGPKRGGFAIGGFDRNKLGTPTDYFMLSADSTRFYIDDTTEKGPSRGGFAIGGFDRNKGLRQDYMKVTVDSTRFFVRDSTAGFGISNIESGVAEGFLHMDKQNYFIGHQTGINSRPKDGAVYNSFIGYNAGRENTTGRKNVFLGFRSGETNSTGFLNVFLGNQSGLANLNGSQNIFIGEGSGMGNVSGNDNVFIGINAGQSNRAGTGNLYLGPQAGQNVVDRSGNVFIGFQSGANSNGSNNVFLGSSSGMFEAESYRLVIENNPAHLFDPLIYGNFVGRTVHINGLLTANATGKSSDIRLKREIEKIDNALPSLMGLNAVSFYYDQDMAENFSLPKKHQFGLIAQELEKIFPELVSTDSFGYKVIDYTTLYSLLIPALQELKSEVDSKDTEIEALRLRQTELEDRMLIMEQMLLKR